MGLGLHRLLHSGAALVAHLEDFLRGVAARADPDVVAHVVGSPVPVPVVPNPVFPVLVMRMFGTKF